MKAKQVSPETAGGKNYGVCVLCGERVKSQHSYLTTKEGYCHRSCISE